MANSKYNGLRWAAVLLAALAAFLRAHLAIDFLYGYSGYATNDTKMANLATEYGIPFIASALAGIAFIVIGVKIAPSNKKHTALRLHIILAAISCIGILTSISYRYYLSTVAAIAQLIGGFAAYIQMEQDKKWENKNKSFQGNK